MRQRRKTNLEYSQASISALLRVGRREFARQGYAAASTVLIARRARLTRGALYYHFRDKRDLFAAVVRDAERELGEHLSRVASAKRDPFAALSACCDAFVGCMLDPALGRLLLLEAPAVLVPRERTQREVTLEVLSEQIRACLLRLPATPRGARQRSGVPAADDLARVLLGALKEGVKFVEERGRGGAVRRRRLRASLALLLAPLALKN